MQEHVKIVFRDIELEFVIKIFAGPFLKYKRRHFLHI